jgi:hypothetical protein
VAGRTTLRGVGIGIVGLALALAPLSAPSASSHKSKHHKSHHTSHHTTTTTATKKGSNPGSALCKDLRAEQAQSAKLGSTIASALESGNYATAKQEMVSSINAGLKEAEPALAALKSAPGAVQSAMKGLIQFDGKFKDDIESSTSLTTLESSFATLGQSATLRTESTTVTNYITAQCGAITPTTTATTLP